MTFTIRAATVADAPIITAHRRAMFEDMGVGAPAELDAMDAKFAPWVAEKIARDEYLGWFIMNEQGAVIAGAGLWIIEGLASPMDQSAWRGYVMNVYVHPDHRRQGLARRLMTTLLGYCRENGLRGVALHASKYGRALYESLGFKPTNEMRLKL